MDQVNRHISYVACIVWSPSQLDRFFCPLRELQHVLTNVSIIWTGGIWYYITTFLAEFVSSYTNNIGLSLLSLGYDRTQSSILSLQLCSTVILSWCCCN